MEVYRRSWTQFSTPTSVQALNIKENTICLNQVKLQLKLLENIIPLSRAKPGYNVNEDLDIIKVGNWVLL